MIDRESITIYGREWRPDPQRSLKTRAAFIPARPLNIDSKGDWLPYRQITFHFAPARMDMIGHAWWATDVNIDDYGPLNPELVGTADVRGGRISGSGTYPTFVRSKHHYSVLAIADQGVYGVWSPPFGWFSGPRRGIPDSPDQGP